jgi:hypothetical protein
MNLPASISERVGDIVGGQRMSIQKPTQTHIDQYAVAAAEFEGTLNSLRQLIEVDLQKLESRWKLRGRPGRRDAFRTGRINRRVRLCQKPDRKGGFRIFPCLC